MAGDARVGTMAAIPGAGEVWRSRGGGDRPRPGTAPSIEAALECGMRQVMPAARAGCGGGDSALRGRLAPRRAGARSGPRARPSEPRRPRPVLDALDHEPVAIPEHEELTGRGHAPCGVDHDAVALAHLGLHQVPARLEDAKRFGSPSPSWRTKTSGKRQPRAARDPAAPRHRMAAGAGHGAWPPHDDEVREGGPQGGE